MRLSAYLAHIETPANQSTIPLAELDVVTDTAEEFGECIRRRVVGRVTWRGPIWDEFLRVWGSFGVRGEQGEEFITVRFIQVDHDYYAFNSAMRLDGDRMTLLLVEQFFKGSMEEYPAAVKARNARVQAYLDRWDGYQITGHDLRELDGLPRLNLPHLSQPLPPDQIDEARKLIWPKAMSMGLARNTIT